MVDPHQYLNDYLDMLRTDCANNKKRYDEWINQGKRKNRTQLSTYMFFKDNQLSTTLLDQPNHPLTLPFGVKQCS